MNFTTFHAALQCMFLNFAQCIVRVGEHDILGFPLSLSRLAVLVKPPEHNRRGLVFIPCPPVLSS